MFVDPVLGHGDERKQETVVGVGFLVLNTQWCAAAVLTESRLFALPLSEGMHDIAIFEACLTAYTFADIRPTL